MHACGSAHAKHQDLISESAARVEVMARTMAQRRLRLDDDDFLAALDEFDAGAGLDATVCRNLTQTGATPIARRRSRHVGRIAIAVAGFLLMAGLGAFSAAIVFQDRVALLLR